MKNNFRTYDLAVTFFRSTQSLPITGALREQLNRAAPSIALILAEGSAKGTIKDQLRFLHIALGSLRECQAILEMADQHNHPAYQEADTLGAHLYCLIKAAKKEAAG